MTKRLKRPRDLVQLGKLIGDILTGQVEDKASIPPEDLNRGRAAVSLGRKGGLKGGRARRSEYSEMIKAPSVIASALLRPTLARACVYDLAASTERTLARWSDRSGIFQSTMGLRIEAWKLLRDD